MDNIKWGCIQPLTGGMYIGAQNAIGHKAEWIISYPTLNSPVYSASGDDASGEKIIDAGNEYHLTQWLKKYDEMPNYYVFHDRKMFQADDDMCPTITTEGGETVTMDYAGKDAVDIVVAVPVCSGLSSATICDAKTKSVRNSNMIWIAKYALNTIRPKVYIFENAPRLMGNVGASVREELEQIAKDAGYSIAYYRTDTNLHDNCQKRPRTFVYFFRWRNEDGECAPQLGYENKKVAVSEFLNRIPKDASQHFPVPMWPGNKFMWDFIVSKYGDGWRNAMFNRLVDIIVKNDLYDEALAYMKDNIDADWYERMVKVFDHIRYKLSIGKGFYADCPMICPADHTPAIQFKTIPNIIHPTEDRVLDMRECLSLMGMPYDFEMYGEPLRVYGKIGQNVPARTAQFIVSEAVRIVDGWDTVDRSYDDSNALVFDNIKAAKESDKK